MFVLTKYSRQIQTITMIGSGMSAGIGRNSFRSEREWDFRKWQSVWCSSTLPGPVNAGARKCLKSRPTEHSSQSATWAMTLVGGASEKALKGRRAFVWLFVDFFRISLCLLDGSSPSSPRPPKKLLTFTF